AVAELAAGEAGFEPADALGRAAMGEAVGDDVTLALLLQAVVADGRSGIQCLVDVAGLDDLALLVGVIGPDAGKAIGLQLDANGDSVGATLAARHAVYLVGDAEQMLHVMPDLMGDH